MKTFEQFKQEVEAAITALNESKPTTTSGTFIIERMAKCQEFETGTFKATLYYRWLTLEGEPLEEFHRNMRYYVIYWNHYSEISGKYTITKDGDAFAATNIKTYLKKIS